MAKEKVKKREGYISKEEMYMMVAIIASKRSKDPNTQVGAAIISEDGRILSTGYNGMPNGCDDDHFPWSREADNELDTKYPYVVHAELNAILNFRGNTSDLKSSTLYTTLFPCNECAKAIIQAGISKIVYLSDKYQNTSGEIAAITMFETAGVNYRQMNPKGIKECIAHQLIPDLLADFN